MVKHMLDAARRHEEPYPVEAQPLAASLADDIADSACSWQTCLPVPDASELKLAVRTLQQYAGSLHTLSLLDILKKAAGLPSGHDDSQRDDGVLATLAAWR